MENESLPEWTDLDLRELMNKDAELNIISKRIFSYDDLVKLGIRGRQLKIGTRKV
jgi:hypothetical protein